jgi:hypothetical protein
MDSHENRNAFIHIYMDFYAGRHRNNDLDGNSDVDSD